jgi:hypothetical protein
MRALLCFALVGGCTVVDDYSKFKFAVPPDLGPDLSSPSADGAAPSTVGSPCTRNTCTAPLTCNENWPSGFCTELCSVAANPCPLDTVCVSVNGVSGGATTVCAPRCKTAVGTCRTGYVCCPLAVEGACLPAGATCQ